MWANVAREDTKCHDKARHDTSLFFSPGIESTLPRLFGDSKCFRADTFVYACVPACICDCACIHVCVRARWRARAHVCFIGLCPRGARCTCDSVSSELSEGLKYKEWPIEYLDISHHRMTEKSAFLIAGPLELNKSLQKLIMDGNPIGQGGCRRIMGSCLGFKNSGLEQEKEEHMVEVSLKDCR
jgi:hypothetical protein